MDLSKLSDAELEAIATGQGGGSSSLASMSDEELQRIAAGSPAGGQDSIVQEMHPDFSAYDRMVVKNFANDDRAAVEYLKRQYPGMDIKTSPSGQIIGRKAGERAYKALDPDNSLLQTIGATVLNPLRGETWMDVTDAGYDLLSGAGTAAATGAAGLAGGAASGGLGAIPAAMAAGAGSSAALEGLRQLAGGALGVNQEANWGDVGLAAGLGAASPLLMGTGASAKGVAKEALKSGISQTGLQDAQRGLVGLGVDKAVKPGLAKLGGLLSGTGSDALQTLGRNFDRFTKTTKDKTGVIDFIDDTGKMVDDRFGKAKSDTWNEFQSALGGYGDEATVDLTSVKSRFKAAIADARQRAATGTEASKGLLERLEGAYDDLFRYTDVEEVPEVTMKGIGLTDEFGREIMQPVTSVTTRPVKKELTSLSPKQAVDLEKKLAELAGYNKIDSRQVTGNRFGSSMTADDKHLEMVASDLKRSLAGSIEEVLPENAIPAKRRYGELLGLENDIEALTKNPRQAFTNLRNADVSSNITNMQQFHKIDQAVGTDLVNRAKFAETIDLFGPGRKSWFHSGTLAKVPAATLGGATGAYIGRQSGDGSGYTTGIAGAGLGLLLGSPAAMKTYIKYGIKAGNANKALAPLRVGGAKELMEEKLSPWTKIRNPE